MTDTKELIERLRERAEWASRGGYQPVKLLCEAADALERLSAERDKWQDTAERQLEQTANLETALASERERREKAEKLLEPFAAAINTAQRYFGKPVPLAILREVALYYVEWTHLRAVSDHLARPDGDNGTLVDQVPDEVFDADHSNENPTVRDRELIAELSSPDSGGEAAAYQRLMSNGDPSDEISKHFHTTKGWERRYLSWRPLYATPPASTPAGTDEIIAVIEAAKKMPRRTPSPGTPDTMHTFRLPASDVWELDKALRALDAAFAAWKEAGHD